MRRNGPERYCVRTERFDAMLARALPTSSGDGAVLVRGVRAPTVGIDGDLSPEHGWSETRGEGEPMRRSRKAEEFQVRDVAARLQAYEIALSPPMDHDDTIEADLLEKAVTLLTFIPRNQPRAKIEVGFSHPTTTSAGVV